MTHKLGQGLNASTRNARSALRQSVFQICEPELMDWSRESVFILLTLSLLSVSFSSKGILCLLFCLPTIFA